MKISPQALRATRKTSVPKRILWSKIEGLILAFWRLGGGGREDVVIVTKFNPSFIVSHKTSFFLSLSAPEKHYISAKAFTRCFGEHRRSILTHRQPSDPTPVLTATFGQGTLHQWTSMAGQFGASWNTCISYHGWLVGFLLQQPSAQGLEGYLRITRDLLKIQRGIRETLTGYGIRQNLGTIYRISLTEVRDAGFSGIRNDRPFQSPSFRPLNNAFNAQQERELEDHLEASVCEMAGVFIKPFNIMGSWPIADNFKYEYHLSSKRKSCLIQLWPAKSEYL